MPGLDGLPSMLIIVYKKLAEIRMNLGNQRFWEIRHICLQLKYGWDDQ